MKEKVEKRNFGWILFSWLSCAVSFLHFFHFWCSLFLESSLRTFLTKLVEPRAGLTPPFLTSPSPFGSFNQPAMRSSFADRVASIAVSRSKVERQKSR